MLRDGDRLILVRGRAALCLPQSQLVEHSREMSSILGHFDARRLSADDCTTVGGESRGQVEGSLAAELDDDRVRALALVDVQDILERKWLEVQLVAGVVVGRNGFGIRIDHDGLPAELSEREGRVDAAVVKLDALSDPVRSAAKDHHLLFAAGAGLVFVAVCRIIVGRIRFELRGAGVDEAIGWKDARRLSGGADFLRSCWRAGRFGGRRTPVFSSA